MDHDGPVNRRVLIIDEVPLSVQQLEDVLRSEGYVVSSAESGEEAFELVASQGFDLILLDIMMPGMDGLEVCKALKALPRVKDVPVIFLTAKADGVDLLRGFHLGAVDCVTKPFNAAELLARVRTHIELKISRDIIQSTNEELRLKNRRLDKLNQELIRALNEIKTLAGILPICSSCKKIRVFGSDPLEEKSWVLLEKYLMEHTEAKLSHGMCPQCLKRLYPEFDLKE